MIHNHGSEIGCTHPIPGLKVSVRTQRTDWVVARMRPTESTSARNDFVAQVTDMFVLAGMKLSYNSQCENDPLLCDPVTNTRNFNLLCRQTRHRKVVQALVVSSYRGPLGSRQWITKF